MKRIYDTILQSHIHSDDEMLFISGPKQVGKTTVSKNAEKLTDNFLYLNWDNEDNRNLILLSPSAIIKQTHLNVLSESKPIIVFDEIHKRPDWKNFLKGFFDAYGKNLHIIVTGSARLDIYKQGSDSLMGRYFPYRMHPLSVAECLRTELPISEIVQPAKMTDEDFKALLEFGGFPKPFIKRDRQFSLRWQNLRRQQFIQEDIRDVKIIHDLNKLNLFTEIPGE